VKSFKFRLAGYLKIKEFEEKNAWNEVIKQETRVTAVKTKIEALITKMEERKAERSQVGLNPAITQVSADLISQSLEALDVRLKGMIKEYQAEMMVLEKLRDQHNEKKKEAKIIDKYQDRKKKDFKVQLDKLEQKQTNESAANLYIRREKKHG
jgi:flagellar biosynthesis chaperone FliJ